MGCDIHCFLEVKKDNKWHHYGDVKLGRWYTLFGLMAGVRDSSITPIAQPKGFPKNASTTTKMHYKNWGVDGHTHSWLSSKEFCEVLKFIETECNKDYEEFKKEHGNDVQKMRTEGYELSFMNYYHQRIPYLFGSTLEGWFQFPDERPKEIDDWRVVFWFDS